MHRIQDIINKEYLEENGVPGVLIVHPKGTNVSHVFLNGCVIGEGCQYVKYEHKAGGRPDFDVSSNSRELGRKGVNLTVTEDMLKSVFSQCANQEIEQIVKKAYECECGKAEHDLNARYCAKCGKKIGESADKQAHNKLI